MPSLSVGVCSSNVYGSNHMPRKYQNVAFTRDAATFVEVENPKLEEVKFSNSPVSATIMGQKVQMFRGSVSYRREAETTNCGEDCPVTFVESASLSFSVKLNDATALAELRTELDRLVDDALANHSLTKGLVPPVYATFAQQ